MNRRSFLAKLGGVSSSFVVGTTGGCAVGAAATYLAVRASELGSKLSYSQQGEDLVVESILTHLQFSRLTYLDIEAGEPIAGSNTYLFYRHGFRGVLVEPNPKLCGDLSSVRPQDKVLNVGIASKEEAEADYFVTNEWPRNTFSREVAESYPKTTGGRVHVEKVIKMPLVNINRVIAEHFQQAPDFISIDTEGLDLDILTSLDFDRYRPAVVCAETMSGVVQVNGAILDLMKSKDYGIRGGSIVNTIFVDNRLLAALG
jgi:FkbM family methyltransferase